MDSRMRLITCSLRPAPPCACLLLALLPSLPAQTNSVLSLRPVERIRIKRGEEFSQKLTADLRPGFHVNSNAPADEYLIPLKLTWIKGQVEAEQVTYPKPQLEKYEFSEKPVSVFSGSFDLVTKFKTSANAPGGPATVNGKL